MVASRSETKRRRRESSLLDSNPKRTKVHAQRKFAQGVSGLSNLLTLTPVKEKPDKPLSNGLGGSPGDEASEPEEAESQSDVVTTGKRALPARGAKKPSIDDMITFLCYRGTSALPSHLVHLNKAPSPEPATQSQPGSTDCRRKQGATSRERDKGNNKKPMMPAPSSAQKAVNVAQALKRKYQEQRIKKTSVSTINIKATPLLRTTRSSAGAISNLASRNISKRIVAKKSESASPSKKKDSSSKDESMKTSVKLVTGKGANSKPQASGGRRGLRSRGTLPENVLQSSIRNQAPKVAIKNKKPSLHEQRGASPQSKKLATSLSDFSSEDDQPLVKKLKPLAQVQKLIKKSIANIGRKMKMEPRRSKRGLSMSPSPPRPSVKRTHESSCKQPSTSTNLHTSSREDETKPKTTAKKKAPKEINGLSRRSSSQESLKKDLTPTLKSTPSRMKKGAAAGSVHDTPLPVETRSRRGSRDLRDISADDKTLTGIPQHSKNTGPESKKNNIGKSSDPSKRLSGDAATSKTANPKPSTFLKNPVELSLTTVLKSPPDLRIPPSIKRPMTAVGITNPMAIAAAAAVVCKSSVDKSKNKDSFSSEDSSKEAGISKEQSSSKIKFLKEVVKAGGAQTKVKQSSESKTNEKDSKSEKTTEAVSLKKKLDETSDEDSKPIMYLSKDVKKSKIKVEMSDSGKVIVPVESPKPSRTSRKTISKSSSVEDDINVIRVKAVTEADDSKLSSRARRSNIRTLKKVHSSDEDDCNELSPSRTRYQENAKATQALKKTVASGNEKVLNTSSKWNRLRTRQGTIQSSDDEIKVENASQNIKTTSKSFKEDSSENDDSDNASDDSAVPVSKPSTRSAVKSKMAESKSLRSTRSGNKSLLRDEDQAEEKIKLKQKSENNNTSSDNDSDSEKVAKSKAPKTRSRSSGILQYKNVVLSGSSEESDDKSSTEQICQTRRSTTSKRTAKSNLRSTSSDLTSSSSQDVDEDDDYKCNRTSSSRSTRKLILNKLDQKTSTTKTLKGKRFHDAHSKSKLISDEDSDTEKKKSDEKGKPSKRMSTDYIVHKKSRSPRRSSRRSLKSKIQDVESDVSGGSSSESSPSQNRRVLRERRGFFSFAEVDPLSDSEEEVLAATKASLEMISQQKPPEDSSQGEPNSTLQLSAPLPQESEDGNGKESTKAVENSKSDTAKIAKKSKADQVQSKKSLSKKRVKPPSEVQPNLNEELEKTLLSINLSPQQPKTTDKAPECTATLEDIPVLGSEISFSNISSPSKTVSESSVRSPPPATSKPQKSGLISPPVSTHILPGPKAVPAASAASVGTAPSGTATSAPSLQTPLRLQCPGFAVKSSPVQAKVARQPNPTACSGPATSIAPVAQASVPVVGTPLASLPTSMPLALPIPVSVHTAVASGMASGITVGMNTTRGAAPPVPGPLPTSIALPIGSMGPMASTMSMPITLNSQLGIPMQTSVPMSGTMTLPLQMGPLASGASSSAPFLLPVQSTLTPILAPGQAIIKKESGGLGGMTNAVGSASSLMVGMNPLVVNSNRTFFLSTGSTMTMTSSQQQMVPGPLMPSLLSLRLPDKPAGQQTIVASSPVYLPIFGNAGIIQTQGQVQPQIQTVAGVPTITTMPTNIQNTVGSNLANPVHANIQNSVSANIQGTTTGHIHNAGPSNVQSPVTCNLQNAVATNVQNPTATNAQGTASLATAMTLSQSHASGGGTGMKRQLVLATKNGPVSKLILSVGEDGSHVLAAASPNSVTTSEGQTLMSVMQPVQHVKQPAPVLSVPMNQSSQVRPSVSTIAPKLTSGATKSVPLAPSNNATRSLVVKQPVVHSPVVSTSSSGQIPVGTSMAGTPTGVRAQLSTLPIVVTCLPSNTVVQMSKPGMLSGSGNVLSSSLSSGEPSVTKTSVAPRVSVSSPVVRTTAALLSSTPVSSSVMYGRGAPNTTNILMKPETKVNTVVSARPTVSSVVTSSTSKPLQLLNPTTSVATLCAVSKVVTTASGIALPSSPNRLTVSKPVISVSLTSSCATTSPVKVLAGSPCKIGTGDVKILPAVTVSPTPVLTSRIPSAPAALAALKSPIGSPTSTRAIAKTGSSRKPYSTAASYAAAKTTDSAAPVAASAISSVPCTSSTPQGPPSTLPLALTTSSAKTTTGKPSAPKVMPGVKLNSLPIPLLNKNPVAPPMAGNSEPKHKSSEVELAPTHRTLSMLSTAFQGISKERKRDISSKKPTAIQETCSAGKPSDPLDVERSGLDNLAEIATSLAERSTETCTNDKRAPEHSLWANPAQILGRETLRVPGLPITANVGTNLPTKNDLAKMKSGAVLADAVEKRPLSENEKLPKVKTSSSASEKSSVSGLLTSSKADTPRQKVQKWLDDGSKSDLDHKGNCSLLSNGNNCTCDVMEEDISNLNSLADVCVSMERINSPVEDCNVTKQSGKLSVEKRKKQDCVEPVKSSPQSSPAKPSPPLNSHQMKVTWQNAFGVKSPSRTVKVGSTTQSKQMISTDELKKNQVAFGETADRGRKVTVDKSSPKGSPSHNHDKVRSKKDESVASCSSIEPLQEKKAQRRSLLSRAADQSQSKLDSSAFSADNESSVYAFEADTDTPPTQVLRQPFRRRSKTLSRSDEEDSMSIGSTSNPIAVHVSKDPVFVPIQLECDESPATLLTTSQAASEKNRPGSPQDDSSDIYYIPLGGQEGSGDNARAVAVRLGKEGPDNRVVMSAKLVKKPPTFKHPNDSSDDGFPNKRSKLESVQTNELETSSGAQCRTDVKSISDSRNAREKNKHMYKETSRSSILDSSSEDTSSLSHMPSSSKDLRESRSSMSPASSRNRSPMSDKTLSPAPHTEMKTQARCKRQSSVDSDTSEKAQPSRRGPKSKSSSRVSPSPSLPSTSSTSSGPSRPAQKSNRSYNGPVPGNVSEAPVFHPTEKEFQDPYAYIEKIRPIAEKYGLCRIVAPHSFKPDCNVEDDIRFTADNQYVHKMMDRWGPNAKEMRAIVKYIAQHNIHLKHAPLVGGMELDLPRLYTTVQNFGGLMEVMDKKRWTKVAETMRIPKSAQDRASKLDEVYCKCLLPYETLKTGERDNLFEMVEVEWEMRKERRDKRLAATAVPSGAVGASGISGADAAQGSGSSSAPASSITREDEDEDEEDDEEDEEDECIVKGRSMPLTTFYRTARNTIHMWFKGSSPSAAEVEHEFWRHVRDRNFHICVNSGSVDCSDPPYGFPTRNSPFAKHPWNLKVFSNNSGSVLRSLGSVIGVTVPTLHFGMVFTTCCWYRDPHNLPWIEYLHTGAKKIWYGIPEHGGEKFREAMQEVAPHYVRKKTLWLASDTAMIPPNMLTERKVPLCRTVQEPGQFIVVFPQAHTSSVATGYIVSESVSFAPPNWILTAVGSFKEMQNCNEPPLFSLDKLVFSIVEDPKTSLNVLNSILPAVMEILEREISGLRDLKKMGVSIERMERSKKKSSGKKGRLQKDVEDIEVMECEVCSTNLYLSMLVNTEDDLGYCVIHGKQYMDQKKLSPSQCKFLHMYNQNELHGFCQTLLDRIETKSGKKGSNFSSNNSDSGSSVSTSTRN